MKEVGGSIMSLIGLAILIDGGVSYGKVGDSPWWLLALGIFLLGFGLELVIDAKINKAKQELREEFDRER